MLAILSRTGSASALKTAAKARAWWGVIGTAQQNPGSVGGSGSIICPIWRIPPLGVHIPSGGGGARPTH
jgi:hypothetical protein